QRRPRRHLPRRAGLVGDRAGGSGGGEPFGAGADVRSRAGLAALAVTAGLLGCGGPEDTTVAATALGLPARTGGTSLAATTLYTSPDGGIYRNPDPTEVTLAAPLSGHPLADRLGAGSDWSALLRLGDLT